MCGIITCVIPERTSMTDQDQVKQRSADVAMDPDAGASLYCPYCSYDLRALAGEACPECGGAVDEASLKAVQVPWQSRREIGKVRALIRTAFRVTFRTKRFCYAVSRPVSYADARRFQRWIVILLWLGLLLPVLMIVIPNVAIFKDDVGLIRWYPVSCLLAGLAGLIPFLFLATGVHAYWLHPKHLSIERQNRAVALGYYACGPLLLIVLSVLPITAGIVYGNYWVGSHTSPLQDIILIVLTGLGLVMMGASAAAFWRVCFVMACKVAERGPVGRWSLPLLQPLIVALFVVLLPLGLPAVMVYLNIIMRTY